MLKLQSRSADCLTNCNIILTGDKITFKSGEVIEGNLILTNHQDLHCYGISVHLEGTAYICFKDGSKTFWNHEELISASCFVFGKRTSVQKVVLSPSRHSFPFSFQIIPTCQYPASFKSSCGAVVYQLVAYIESLGGPKKTAEKVIILRGNHLLEPESQQPITFSKCPPMFPYLDKTRSKRQVRLSIQLQKSGFLPGEEVHFLLRLRNPERGTIWLFNIKLIQLVKFHTEEGSKSTSRIIVNREEAPMSSKQNVIWKESLVISRGFVAPSCRSIIEHQYFLQAEVFMNGNRPSNIVVCEKAPIVIGTGNKVGHSSLKEATTSEKQCIFE